MQDKFLLTYEILMSSCIVINLISNLLMLTFDLTCNINRLHMNISIFHVHINRLHRNNITMLHIDMITMQLGGKKILP